MTNPYRGLPDYHFWKRSVAGVSIEDLDPVVSTTFTIKKQDKVVTAGSCFAQHVARYLKNSGFNYYVTEPGNPLIAPVAERNGYGVFSARYGNLYTTRQLLQLYLRAHGLFHPVESIWRREDGAYVDPYRPQIQPCGFSSPEELLADREQHFAMVRKAFDEMDVFVFTLGLTESWISRLDGSVFPVAPGVSGGEFDEKKYRFVNFGVSEVVEDLQNFLSLASSKNKSFKTILTVSPVPLMATAEDRHVLVSTTLSKSILRVAADIVEKSGKEIMYFPSYEMITGNYTRGKYYASDLRSITESGVSRVMSVFMNHFSNEKTIRAEEAQKTDNYIDELEEVVRVQCEEEALGKIG